jgi:hypothetical protein
LHSYPSRKTASSVKKVSVSVDAADLRWLQTRARKLGMSLSAVVTEAARLLQQREAREELLADLGEKASLSDRDRRAIDKEWKGSRSTRPR